MKPSAGATALIVWTAFAGPAFAEDVDAFVVLWSTGSFGEDRALWLDRMKRLGEPIAEFVELPSGYPLPGDSSNFTLGHCPKDRAKDGEEAVRLLKGILGDDLGTFSEKREAATLACPRPRMGWTVDSSWDGRRSEGGHDVFRLRALKLVRATPEGEERTVLIQLLSPRSGDLLDWRVVKLGRGCDVRFLKDKAHAGLLSMEKSCGGAQKEELAFTNVNGKVSQPPGVEASSNLQAVIWAERPSADEARTVLGGWKEEGAVLTRFVSLAASYPRIATADQLPGVPPAVHAVVLAVCPEDRLQEALTVMKSLSVNLDLRKVTPSSGTLGCPTVLSHPNVETRFKKDGLELLVVADEHDRFVYLRNADRKLLGRRNATVDGQHVGPGFPTDFGCQSTSNLKGSNLVGWKWSGCRAQDSERHCFQYSKELSYTISDGKLDIGGKAAKPIRVNCTSWPDLFSGD
jgi:hypothetical protein